MHTKVKETKFLSRRKVGHGQARVIIWIVYVVPVYKMLHTKFQGHRSFGSGEDKFLKFLLLA